MELNFKSEKLLKIVRVYYEMYAIFFCYLLVLAYIDIDWRYPDHRKLSVITF